MHLICGECGALLLDTGYGIGNLKSVIEQLTDKPVSVFNTHWHGDHTGGNSQFENVYMHEFDIPYWKESLSCEAGRMLPVTLAFSQDAVIPLSDKFIRAVHDGMTFHLGGRIETIVHMPGHSAGNCMVIDSKTGILFSGDAILSTPTLVIDGFPAVDHAELLTVEAFHTALVQHMKQLNKVKWLCPSHGRLMLSNKYVSAMQHCTEEILKAPDKWERYDYIPSLPGMIRCVDDAMIVYTLSTPPNNNTPCFKNSCHILYKYNRLFWRKYNIHPPPKKIHRCKNTIFRQLGSCVLPSVGWRDIQLLIIKEGGSTLGYRPLGYTFAKTGGAVNGGRSPFTCR